MAEIELKNVTKIYKKKVKAVNNINLKINNGEFIVLVGPSGCGKTTILRMIAGLEEISEGELLIDGKIMNEIEPQKRGIAMVFQSYALYPHLTVYENLAFPLKIKKIKKDEIDRKVKEVADILNLSNFLNRMPRELSGGQRQRVALGRAMVRNPKVFLFDEPLSNLDAKLRVEMRVEINEMHKRLKTNFIYVTHDQVEAMTLGERIVVLKDGILQQFATPDELYYYPSNMFVAGFVGTPPMNFFMCEISKEENEFKIKNNDLNLKISSEFAEYLENYKNDKIILGIRAKDIYLESESFKTKNNESYIKGKYLLKELLGDEILYYFKIESVIKEEKIAVIKSDKNIDLTTGNYYKLFVDVNRIYLFDVNTKNSIMKIKGETYNT